MKKEYVEKNEFVTIVIIAIACFIFLFGLWAWNGHRIQELEMSYYNVFFAMG